MTRISTECPLIRETGFVERGRTLIVELHPRHLTMRFKGTRQRWQATYEGILWSAVRRDAEQKRLEKIAARRTKKR